MTYAQVALVTSDAENAEPDLVYAYRPSLLGAPWEFRLTPDGLRWSAGKPSGDIRYDAVRQVRLSYRPAKMQAHRFFTEIWAEGAPSLRIGSASWKSMFLQEFQDDAYAAFVTALHRRLAAARPAAVYVQGISAFQYWPVAALFVGVTLSLLVLTGRALQLGMLGGAAFIVAFLVLFGWQSWKFLSRNRPGTYTPDAVPPLLLPKSG